jgi:hypothetical protein
MPSIDFNTNTLPRWEALRAAQTAKDLSTAVAKALASDQTAIAALTLGDSVADVNTFERIARQVVSVSGLAYWLVPSPAVLFTDTGGTTPVTADGQNVKCWSDLVNGWKATEATNPPLYKTQVVGGYDAIRFNGTSSVLALEAAGLVVGKNVAGLTAIGVFVPRRSASASNDIILAIGTNANTSRFASEISRTNDKAISVAVRAADADAGNAATSAAAAETKDVACVATWWMDYTNASSQCWVNGASKVGPTATGTTAGNTANTNSSAVRVGASAAASASSFAQVDLLELIVYQAAISTANRQLIERYLGNKYGIVVA